MPGHTTAAPHGVDHGFAFDIGHEDTRDLWPARLGMDEIGAGVLVARAAQVRIVPIERGVRMVRAGHRRHCAAGVYPRACSATTCQSPRWLLQMLVRPSEPSRLIVCSRPGLNT